MANGRAIDRDYAQKLMNFREGIVKDTRPAMNVLFTIGGNQLAHNHFIKEENVFIFDADLIQKLITPEGSVKGADKIVLILGAHDADDSGIKVFRGDRTIIIAGCIQDGDKLKSIKVDKPAVEHPPRRADVIFPKANAVGDEGAIEINLL